MFKYNHTFPRFKKKKLGTSEDQEGGSDQEDLTSPTSYALSPLPSSAAEASPCPSENRALSGTTTQVDPPSEKSAGAFSGSFIPGPPQASQYGFSAPLPPSPLYNPNMPPEVPPYGVSQPLTAPIDPPPYSEQDKPPPYSLHPPPMGSTVDYPSGTSTSPSGIPTPTGPTNPSAPPYPLSPFGSSVQKDNQDITFSNKL